MPLTFLTSSFSIIAAVGLVLITAVLAFMGWRKSGFNFRVGLLELLRVLIVALVAITLNQPEWLRTYQPTEFPTLLVLSDESGSMQTLDILQNQTAITRAQSIAELSAKDAWSDIKSLDVVVERFSSDLDDPKAGTDLNHALSSALKRYENLRGVILASDGDWNVGDSPTSAASRLRLRGVPIYSIVAGSESKLPDLVVQRFDAPAFGIVSRPLRLPFEVRSSLPRDVQTEMILKVLQDGSEVDEVRQSVTIPAMGTLNESLLWRPQQTGDFELALELPTQAGELVKDNNLRRVPIAVREEAIKVLLIESFPRWEYRYLRNALERDPGVDVSCLLFHPGLSKLGGGRGYIKTFPKTLEELAKFDVVFLGDVGVGERQLTLEQCRLLKGLVRSQASGLIFMPGIRGEHLSLMDTELEELYPVVLDAGQRKGWGSREPAQFELTETGRRSLLTKLEDDEGMNADLWETLPGFHWYAATSRSKAGTEVLATHKTEMGPRGRIPLLVTKAYGTGKVLFMGTDAAWRWRKGVEDKYHYRFWGQVARWMAYQRNIAQGERMRLFYSPDRPLVDGLVNLNANVMSESGEPLQEGTVTVQAVAPNGETETIRLRANGDEWGLFTSAFTPKQRGEYRMVLACRENNSTLETTISVQGLERERVGEPARFDVMKELAAISGGRVVTPDQVSSIVNDVQQLPEPEPIVRRLRIWSHPLWAMSIVVLLGVFWTGRKMVGQV